MLNPSALTTQIGVGNSLPSQPNVQDDHNDVNLDKSIDTDRFMDISPNESPSQRDLNRSGSSSSASHVNTMPRKRLLSTESPQQLNSR